MMTDLTMPCGYLDDDRQWDEPEILDAEEDSDPRTELEKRISWICSEWADALNDDTSDSWRDVRLMIHGAYQGLCFCTSGHDDRMAMLELGRIAFENSLTCIEQLKYSGAPK